VPPVQEMVREETVRWIWVVFIDQRRRRVRTLRRREQDYAEEILTTGALVLESLGGLQLQTDWLFTEPRPDEVDTLNALLGR
jgi:hypothetical protein